MVSHRSVECDGPCTGTRISGLFRGWLLVIGRVVQAVHSFWTRPWGFWIIQFVGLSALDLFLTWVLVGSGTAYEANPIAAGILSAHGWSGLAVFKAACLGLVLALVVCIGCLDAIAARRVLRAGCATMAVVITYSLFLVHFA